jgi:hypothetical protein
MPFSRLKEVQKALFQAQRSSKSPFLGSKKLKKPFFRLKEAQRFKFPFEQTQFKKVQIPFFIETFQKSFLNRGW